VRGGYIAAGDAWRIKIVRGHRSLYFTHHDSPASQPDVIRPGDRVYAWTYMVWVSPWSVPYHAGLVRVGADVA
jgi:hypothetical protein